MTIEQFKLLLLRLNPDNETIFDHESTLLVNLPMICSMTAAHCFTYEYESDPKDLYELRRQLLWLAKHGHFDFKD